MSAIEKVVKNLADPYEWNWTRVVSRRGAADEFLGLLATEGVIEQRTHPLGGLVWRVNGNLYGRTDGIVADTFEKLAQ